jgi:hypothetical protein
MTYLKYLLALTIIFSSFDVQSQEYDKKTRVVKIFTPEEKDNLQVWFHDEIKNMNFTEEEKDEYISVMTYYIVKIARLDDKDKDYTREEFKKELNILVNKQNAELLEILTNEQYALHTDIYGRFLKAAFNRWGLNE